MILRDNELKILEDDFEKPKATLNFIFGRKRVGKTTLINSYTKNKNTLYLNAFETIPKILFSRLVLSINNFFKVKIDINTYKRIEDLFLFISEQNIKNKIVIVFENLQYIQKVDKDFLSKFNAQWNKNLKKKNIQFIFTSSYYSSNKNEQLLFKKADNTILLKALSFNAIKICLPQINKKDILFVYTIFGTNPEYLKLYDANKSLDENLFNIFFDKKTLWNEGLNIIKNDLGDILTYSSILYAISKGNNKIGDIATFLDLKSSYLTRYLQKLVDLMIINKEIPINDNLKNSKFGRYEIEDNFLKFWFCYFYANATPNKNDNHLLYKYIKDNIRTHLASSAYKKQAFEIISSNPLNFFGFIPNKIGKWWNNKDLEIDIIAFDSKNITFVDCFLKDNISIEEHHKYLKEKADSFETTLNKKYAIFY